MRRQRTPTAARFGGAITRRHAALLLQSGIDGGGGVACVKDLRAHRVVPPASASLDSSSPECVAGAKPEPVDSTPPEDVAAVAAAVEDLERKPICQVLPRSKLVRDPGSFGYRRLLPFLNQMAKNDDSNYKDMPLENTAANSKEFKGSRIWLFEESAGGGYRESDTLESAELVTLKTVGEPEMKDGCDIVGKGTNTVPHDLAGNKPSLTRCTNSRFVHHKSSFSYKRMLPFLMENEISSYEDERVKIRRVTEEAQLTPDENDVSASGKHHLALSEDPSSECKSAPMESIEEEKSSNADENQVLENLQRQPDVLKTSSPECSSAEVQNVIPEEASVLSQDPITSYEGESTSDGIDVLTGEQHVPPVSEDVPEECSRDVTKTMVQDKVLESDGSYVLEPAVSEASPLEDSTSGGQKATEEQPYGDEGSTLTLDKNEFLTKEKPQLCDTKELLTAQVEEAVEVPKPQLCDTSELLTAQVEGTVEFPEVLQFQSPDLGCPDVGLGSPTKTVIPSANQCCTLEHQDAMASLDDPHLDAVMICRTSDPCAVDKFLSVEEMSGAVPHTESESSKVGILQPSEGLSLGKRGLSPKKLSPRKGILKRHTRGCKGICMCLDCCTYRLRADRAFEFSRKQMQEADDIIGNLLKEMANLRGLVEKPAGQRGSLQAACQRSSRVEEVARDRCHQMFMDLNSHCRIPGPRVRFTQFVEEKLGSSPHSSKHLEDKMGSSPGSSKHLVDKLGSSPRSNKHVEDNMGSSHNNSFSKRRCLKR
ncbi:hypothetical protein QOZ80_1BG0054830 [Eleusine coracana subsp. coracana]|nr:hypothetical protein QOZ80_1BG0054830 [Eleusine coracana subsp. coracana]